MNSAILLVALAAWCACAAPPAAAAAAAAHRTRRGLIERQVCPAGTVPYYGLCVDSHGETPNRIRMRRSGVEASERPPRYVPFENKYVLVPDDYYVAVPEQKSAKPARAKRMSGFESRFPIDNHYHCPKDYIMVGYTCVKPPTVPPGPVDIEDVYKDYNI